MKIKPLVLFIIIFIFAGVLFSQPVCAEENSDAPTSGIVSSDSSSDTTSGSGGDTGNDTGSVTSDGDTEGDTGGDIGSVSLCKKINRSL